MHAATVVVLVTSHSLQAQSTITGTVREDSTGRPLPGAEVTFDSLPRMTLSDVEGRYTLRDVPAGNHRVHVRLLGYRAVDVDALLTVGSATVVNIRLTRATPQLDTVAVIAAEKRKVSKGFLGFEERQKRGLGKFIGPAQLRENDERRLEDVLRELRGLSIISPPPCGRNRLTCDANGSKRIAAVAGCPVQISIDGALIYRGKTGAIDWPATFDVGELSVISLAGVEFYRNESDVPAALASPGTTCGMLAFWTRRD